MITDSIELTIQYLHDVNEDIVIENSKPSVSDTSKTPLIIENPVFNDDIVQATNSTEEKGNGIKLIDMYQPITSLANTCTNLNVSYQKSTDESKYQVINIKLGKFSFERKRNK